mgnify:CR=1 FL=1
MFHIEANATSRRNVAHQLTAFGLVVRSFASAAAFLEAIAPRASGCFVVDLDIERAGGLGVRDTLAESGFDLPVVYLASEADVPSIVRAMRSGAVDVLMQPVSAEQLRAAVEQALDLDMLQSDSRDEVADFERRYDSMTERERAVLAEIVAGRRNKETAFALGIAERTVKHHRARVLEKMGAESALCLARMVEKLGRAAFVR